MELLANVQSLCRLCGSKTKMDNRVSIFDSKSDLDLNNKIAHFLDLHIIENDSLPQYVCNDCVEKLENFNEFKELSHKTNLMFNDLLHKKSSPTPSTSNFENVHNNFSILSNALLFGNTKQTELQSELESDTNEALQASIMEPEIQIKMEEEDKNDPIDTTATKPKFFTDNFLCLYQSVPKTPATNQDKTRKQVYKCIFCDATFYSRQFALEHTNLVHSIRKKVNVKANVTITNTNPVQCNTCNETYESVFELNQHIKTHKTPDDSMKYTCDYCNKQLKTADTLRIHIKRHNKDYTCFCNYCNKGFFDSSNLKYHIRSNHTKEYPYHCTHCPKKFVTNSQLKHHILVMHTEGLNYECDICKKIFKTELFVKSHKLTHIPIEERKKFKCDLCDLTFVYKSNVRKHIATIHMGKLPYKCHLCKRGYSSTSGLKIHLLTHSGVKNFVCEVCGKPFAVASNLKVHLRVHTGEKPFQCKVCNQSFTQSSTLNLHRKKYCQRKKLK